MRKIEKVVELLDDLKKKQFTGFIRINYSQGGITRIEKNEEILSKIQPER
jgi:cell division septation protein DedD